MEALIIVVPLYKNAHLIHELVQSLVNSAEEIRAANGRILFINDSPDDVPLAQAIESDARHIAALCDFQLITNERNLGFIRSCNIGLECARQEGADALLLNSDALLTPGALTEMISAAAVDPMIGFVSPRSNNATICNSPYPDTFRSLSFNDATRAHNRIKSFLPKISYVPTAVGFCLLIRHLMLEEFGLLDTIYGAGYNEENDFIMRCNRRGYRAVMANHAFAFHFGSSSFSLTEMPVSEREARNRRIFLDRYPEYERAVSRYFTSIEYKAQSLISGFVPGADSRQRILFECSNLGPHFNGTFELATRTISAFVKLYRHEYSVFISCSSAAFAFHGLNFVEGLNYAGERDQAKRAAPYAAAIRLAQPFLQQDLLDLANLAPITCFLVLDTIALDCQNLDEANLDVIWNQMVHTTSIIGYISEFSKKQFQRRFPVPKDVTEIVSFLSTNPSDYLPVDSANLENAYHQKDYVLIVGNHYAHKHVAETVALFQKQDILLPLMVLGVKLSEQANVTSYQAGNLTTEHVNQLYANASVVVFPSHYEGFGLPIMHALSRRKPVIARNIPASEEIRRRTDGFYNLHLVRTTAEMVRLALSKPVWLDDHGISPLPVQTWDDTARALHGGLESAKKSITFTALSERLRSLSSIETTIPLPNSNSSDVVNTSDMISEMRTQLIAIQTSTSWKITLPFRIFGNFLKRMSGRGNELRYRLRRVSLS